MKMQCTRLQVKKLNDPVGILSGTQYFDGVCYFKMDNKNLGCVYFFKHLGIPLVKIGFTRHATPQNRYAHFNAFAPYGGVCIGYIQSADAYQLEVLLHEKYSAYRTRLEWFNLTESKVRNIIKEHRGIINFSRKKEVSFTTEIPVKIQGENVADMINECKNNKAMAAKKLGVSRQTLYKHIRKNVTGVTKR